MDVQETRGDGPAKSGGGARWILVLFGMPFAAVGIGVSGWLIAPTVMDWQAMKSWTPVQAELLAADLHASSDSDGATTYRATARYRYEINGDAFVSDRVAISGSSDNIGDFQETLGRQLETAFANQTPVTAYVDPENPAHAVINRDLRGGLLALMGVFALIFGAVGLGIMAAGFLGDRSGTGVTDSEQPWRERKEWQSPEIRSGARGGAIAAWAFALLWCAISGVATWALFNGSERPLPALAAISLFDAVGALMLAWAVRATLSARRFGELVLRMDPHPGSIGGDVGGMIDIPLRYDAQRAMAMTLSCVHVYTQRSGKNSETRRDPKFSDTRHFLGEPTANDMMRVHFRFPVPAGLPVSSAGASDRHVWSVDIACELPGVDLSRSFEIPVFSVVEKTRVASRVRESQATSLARLETLMNLEQVPGGIAMDFRAGRAWKGALAALVFGAIFGAVPIFMAQAGEAGMFTMLLFGSVFGLVGALLVAASVWMLGNRLRVQIDDEGVHVQRYLFGIPVRERRHPRASLTGIVATSSGSMSSGSQVTVFYDLAVRLVDESQGDVGIGDGFRGYGDAQRAGETIAGFTRLPFLGERSANSGCAARKAAYLAQREKR